MSPREAKTYAQILKLKSDNYSTNGHWILLNGGGEVVIAEQVTGEAPTAKMKISRREFNRIVNWYVKEQN
jgi:hypothetical protein